VLTYVLHMLAKPQPAQDCDGPEFVNHDANDRLQRQIAAGSKTPTEFDDVSPWHGTHRGGTGMRDVHTPCPTATRPRPALHAGGARHDGSLRERGMTLLAATRACPLPQA
jgi:hypothetical protein